jgi:hypothetical protein
MSGNIYISPPAATPTILNQDINLNSVLQGQVSYNTDINVFLEDSLGNPITPTGSVLVGNDLTATLATPNPSGVALQRPIGDQFVSYRTGDTGWRVQNQWFYYTPPTYPAKFAKLKNMTTSGYWYTLETALSVNGVSSTQRFVDASGIQSWSALNNLNLSVIDKLTGLMFTRTRSGLARNWNDSIDDALAYSATINGNTYSDWYLMSLQEAVQVFGNYVTSPTWTDPVSGQTIYQFQNSASMFFSDTKNQGFFDQATYGFINTTNRDLQFSIVSKGTSLNTQIFVTDVSNLIS